ncbi:MAG: CIA30 family protein [Pseudomonadota bacterium]
MTPAGADSDKDTEVITDLTSATPSLGWFVVNDNVMGGRSEGGFDVDSGVLRFTGRTNTRGGGFSSIRTGSLALDLSAYDGIRLHVKGDGRRYTWRLTTDARYYGREVAYWAEFDTERDEWRDIDIPFARFVPRFRGSVLDGPALDTSNITGMGLMIYDGLDGPFALALDRVQAVAEID